MEEETLENESKTYTDPITGKFVVGNPGGGRPKETEHDKIIKKATQELIKEYKESLGEALPLIKPIIIAKALEGDMTAIKEIHDRVMDKSKQPTDITSDGEKIAFNIMNYGNNDTLPISTEKLSDSSTESTG